MSNTKDLDVQASLSASRQLSEVFHLVNRLLPEGQEVCAVGPETTAREALELMHRHGYSQLPIKQGDSVLGLFSFRAFALEVARADKVGVDPASLTVEEFLEHEKPSYARVTDEFRALIDVLDSKDAVIVSSPDALIAIVTPMDVLRYLYNVTSPFVLIAEIELALRGLMHFALPDPEVLARCAAKALARNYEGRAMPDRLEKMTFDDYISVIRFGGNWDYFAPVLGGTRERAQGRLEPVRNLRNDVFHFRREISVGDHNSLTACRDWLLRCTRKIQAKCEDAN